MSQPTTQTQVSTQTVSAPRADCRLCGSHNLATVFSFGDTPLANNYLSPEQITESEPFAPLTVNYCTDCSLVQLRDVVDPNILFSHYLYVSSTSPSFVKHFADYAHELINRFNLTDEDLVVDIGSNDGVLLKALQDSQHLPTDRHIQTLGVDPAANLAATANAAGIETLVNFFTPTVAQDIASQRGPATVITANNVFAHTDDIVGFTTAVKELLAPHGAFVFEVQYLADLLQNNLFDIVYHEHTCYYHLTPLSQFFAKHNLEVFDVQAQSVHGGSLRVFVQHAGGPHARTPAVAKLLKKEALAGLNTAAVYQEFAQRIEQNKRKLQALITKVKADGKTIVGYGAPAKATTLMYAFEITGDHLEYIVDDAPLKQGRLMPGTHIPIHSPDKLYADTPDYCLILAWNFADPIMANHAKFAEQGGKFIVPTPEPHVV